MLKKMLIILLMMNLFGCQSAENGNVVIDEEGKETDEQLESEEAQMPLILDGYIVSNQQKEELLAWLDEFDRVVFEGAEEYIRLENGIPVIVEKYEGSVWLSHELVVDGITISIFDVGIGDIPNLLTMSNSDEIYRFDSDPRDYYYRPLFDLNKEMIVNDFGKEMQLECAYPPSDAWVSSQYQSKNFADVTIDMPNYYIGIWEEPDLSEDEETRRWEQLLLAFQMKQSSNYDQLKSAVLLSKPFSTNLEWGLIEEVEINGIVQPLQKPIGIRGASFYHGKDVRLKYKELYGEEMGEPEKLIESWENIVYDAGLDIFILSNLGDNMQMEMEVVTSFVIEQQIQGNELILEVVNIMTSYDKVTGIKHMRKNSGLPILNRHFSDESKADGVLKVSELLKDQKDSFDYYRVVGELNDQGSYSLKEFQLLNEVTILKEDVIFYNKYLRDDEKIVFLPLFDSKYCNEANRILLNTLNSHTEPDKVDYCFYEDEAVAVIFGSSLIRPSKLKNVAYIFDKQNQVYNPILDQAEAKVIIDELKKENPHLLDDTPVSVFYMEGEKYVYLHETEATYSILIRVN